MSDLGKKERLLLLPCAKRTSISRELYRESVPLLWQLTTVCATKSAREDCVATHGM